MNLIETISAAIVGGVVVLVTFGYMVYDIIKRKKLKYEEVEMAQQMGGCFFMITILTLFGVGGMVWGNWPSLDGACASCIN